MPNKVGRPVLLDEAHDSLYRSLYVDVKSKRHLQNIHYQTKALVALKGKYDIASTLGKGIFRTSILAEIGRLAYHDNNALISEVVEYLKKRAEKEKKTVHEWRDIAREIRERIELVIAAHIVAEEDITAGEVLRRVFEAMDKII